jgi:hypothetical protein
MKGGTLLRPERAEEIDILIGPPPALMKGDAEHVELLLQPPGCDAEEEAAVRQHVEAREFLREHHRVAVWEDEYRRAQFDPRRDRGHVG